MKAKANCVNVTVIMDKDEHRRLKELAKEKERSVSGQIRLIIKSYLNIWNPPPECDPLSIRPGSRKAES